MVVTGEMKLRARACVVIERRGATSSNGGEDHRAQAGAGPSQGCAFGPRAPRPRPPEPSGASTWADGGTGRRALPAPGPRTNAAIGAPPGVTRRSGAPPARSKRHRGSPRVLPDTSAPRHSAPPTCSGVCRGSGGAGVTLQPEPCHPSAGADVSRIRRGWDGDGSPPMSSHLLTTCRDLYG